MHPQKTGFTLVELLIAAAASLILIGVALSGLITLQRMSQQVDERLVQEAELQRALKLMAADIQEGQRIQANPPALSGYEGLFEIVRPGRDSIAYYTTRRGNRVWAGPHILYRRDFSEKVTYALVDQIADISEIKGLPSNLCAGSGITVTSQAAVVAWIDRETTVKVCLLGHLPQSPQSVKASMMVSTRVALQP